MHEVFSNVFVPENIFGKGSISRLPSLLERQKTNQKDKAVILIDEVFRELNRALPMEELSEHVIVFVSTSSGEPTTTYIDDIMHRLRDFEGLASPCAVVGIGGGSTMDVAKAVSNLFTNPGKAEEYQGWDLLQERGIYKIGVPTISGTGAEVTRTCVMTSPKQKLGMNSHFSVFDLVVMDPELLSSVPKDQAFFTGMDCYIHCVESLNGRLMNSFAEGFAIQSLNMCRDVFLKTWDDEKLMVASYLGGISVATTLVGMVHPISAGLSKVIGYRHGIANCLVFNVVPEFYKEVSEFHHIMRRNDIKLPKFKATDSEVESIIAETFNHTKPLWNALGDDWQSILTPQKIAEIVGRMGV